MAAAPMVTVRVDGEPNGLAASLKDILEKNLNYPRIQRAAARLRCTAVVRTDYDVAVTIQVADGAILLKNGAAPGADVELSGGFADLAELCVRKLNPLVALLRHRVRVKGPLRKAMKLQKVMILVKEEL